MSKSGELRGQPATTELQALSKLKMAGRLRYWRGAIEIPEVELHAICDEIQAEHEQAIAATLGAGKARADETDIWECVCDSFGHYCERMTVHVMECGSCGRTFEHVSGMYAYCPHCRCTFGKEDE